MLLNFVHVFPFLLQICSTVIFSFLFKMLPVLSNNTSSVSAPEHLTEAQAGVLAEESWNAFFSVEVFMHKQVKGETGKYFRIFQHVKWNHSTLPSCPLHACLCWRAVRLGSTPANIIYWLRSDPKKYHIHLLFQEAKNMSAAFFIWKIKGNIQQILQSFSKWYSCNIRKVL